MQADCYDIIIIGTGSGGGTIAQQLAPSGEKILILERGTFITKEKENWDVNEVVVKGRYRTDEIWYDKEGDPFKPFTHYAVGGVNTEVSYFNQFQINGASTRPSPAPNGCLVNTATIVRLPKNHQQRFFGW